MKISGTSAIITGGASGLGAATAKALSEAGVKVALFDLNEEKGEALAEKIGVSVVLITGRDKGTRWYFKTREGVLVGSFASEREAENGVQDFVDFMVTAPAEMRQRYLVHLLSQ